MSNTLEKNEKPTSIQLWDRSKMLFDQTSSLQVAYDNSITRVTWCVPSGRIQVGAPLSTIMPGSTVRRRSALFCARKLCNAHWWGQSQIFVEFSIGMHKSTSVIMRVGCLSGLPWSTQVVPKFLCTPFICGRPAEVQPGPDALVLLLSIHDGTCGGRRSLLLRSYLSSALDLMQRHTHKPVLIEWRPTSEIWISASIRRRWYTVDPKALWAPMSHTTREYTQTKAWTQNARSLHSLQIYLMEDFSAIPGTTLLCRYTCS